MLVAISGSQGSGKTTVLNELAKRGYHVVERKTSRSIQKDWGYTLEQINADKDLTIKFQWEILKRKQEDERPFIEGDKICFTERSYADLFTYALMVLGKEPSCSDFIDEYHDVCKQAQQGYRQVQYITSGMFPVEWDVNRASANKHYCAVIDNVIYDYCLDMAYGDNWDEVPSEPRLRKVVVISSKSVEERINTIFNSMNWYYGPGAYTSVFSSDGKNEQPNE